MLRVLIRSCALSGLAAISPREWCGGASALGAQPARVSHLDFGTGGEFEEYLRALQVAGRAQPYPWSIRGFSPREVRRLAAGDSTGPWQLARRTATIAGDKSRLQFGGASVRLSYNSGFPYGANDGAVWAGRGLTGETSAGLAADLGPLSVAFAPVAFLTENRAFDLLANGQPGEQAFNHGLIYQRIDLPQRFGDRPYGRVDPGATGLRFDARYLTVGVSTANVWLGPATEYPFLLGTNAPGFAHVFVGTGEPVALGFARVHARFLWGRLHQSAHSPVTGPVHYQGWPQTGTVRLAASGTLVLMPRGVPGLELGLARFFHSPFGKHEPSARFWRIPFRTIFLANEYAQGDTAGVDNQLVSAFARWVFPRAGLEVFGERGYEDHLHDARDLAQNPDHLREYMIGLQKTVRGQSGRLDVLRLESVNYQQPSIARVREEGPIYGHGRLRQGHTNRGQLLGASAGAGAAAAATAAWTRYTSRGRTTVTARRIVRSQRGDYPRTGTPDSHASDVILAAGLERMRFGRRVDLSAKLEAMNNYDRNFVADVGNLSLQIAARLRRW